MDLNPVFATKSGATAADVRIVVDWNPPEPRYRPKHEDIVRDMNRIMKPDAVAVIGASGETGKIGNSVMKNLINGGYKGKIYPINPSADEIMGMKAYKSVKDVPGDIDVAVFAIPAKFVAAALVECGEKKIPGAVLIPSGFAETGNVEGQKEIQQIGRKYGVRLMGPNIYGFYYTWKNLCATFCTAYDVKGHAALSSQSGGIGMAIIGFSRSAKMGVSAIVGLGNKSDIDEDDLLTFFEQDDNTTIIAQHCEDLKDGRAFAEVAKRVSKKKPIVMLKAGRTSMGARAASSHTGALAGNDKIYEDVLKQSGVIRARSLRDLLEFARAIPILPTPKGENVLIITGAGGSGVLLSDACVDNGLSLMAMPPDLDAAFRKFIPPFGAAGNPVDITGGEPPKTYQNTVKLGLEDPRIHALILGYWHTIVTPPMVFAKTRGRGRRGDASQRHREADRGVACGRRRSRGGGRASVRSRRAGVSVHDRNAGGGAGCQVPVGTRSGCDAEGVAKRGAEPVGARWPAVLPAAMSADERADRCFLPAPYFDHDCSSITFPSGSVTYTQVTFDPVAVVSVTISPTGCPPAASTASRADGTSFTTNAMCPNPGRFTATSGLSFRML